jgi:cysteine desulfuration protein SufE
MSTGTDQLPVRLREIVDGFQWGESRDKLELLLYYAEHLEPLPPHLQGHQEKMEKVHECMTPVFVHAEMEGGRLTFFFDVPPESPTVRGYAALLGEGLDQTTPDQVLDIPDDFYRQMGLHEVLSAQRLNGISAILAHMKRLALELMNGTPPGEDSP